MSLADQCIPRELWNAIRLASASIGCVICVGAVALALGLGNPQPAGPLRWQTGDSPDVGRIEPQHAPTDNAQMLLGSGDETFATAPVRARIPFTVEVEAAIVLNEPDACIGLWADADGPLIVAIDGEGYFSFRHRIGGRTRWLVNWREFPHIRLPPMANRIRLDVNYSGATAWINSERAFRAHVDDLPGDGTWGIYSCGPGEVTFTAARLYMP